MAIPFATGAAAALNTGLPEKRFFNVILEKDDTDPEYPLALIEAPGALQRNKYAAAVRGMWQADGHASGKVLIPHGSTMATFTPASNTAGVLAGSIPGTDRGDGAFTETEGLFLFDGKPCVSDGTTIRRATDGVTSDPVLAIGSTPANVATAAFSYSIDGIAYSKGAVAAGSAPGSAVVPLGKYGAVALDIASLGTITAVEAPANATGYDTAADAAAALPAVAVGFIRIGYVTASKSDGAFTFGTTSLAAANTTVAYTDSATNTGFTDLLTDYGQTGFTSVATLGQRGILTFGSRFCYTEVLALNSTTALSYYTAESSPDGLVAARVVAELLYLFGTQTIEAWSQTGDADDPYALQPGMTQQIGCACRDGIVKADNTLFFVDEAFNVRRLGQGSSQIVSDPWVSERLRTAGASGIIGFTYQDRGHIYVGWRTAMGCYFYDPYASQVLGRNSWHTRATNNTDTWRYTDIVTAGARVFVADGTGQFDELSRTYTSESMPDVNTMGTEIVREFSAFKRYKEFQSIPALKLVISQGVGTVSGQGSDPLIAMRMSFDGGSTWTAWRPRKLGAIGEYDEATIWRVNGSAVRRGVIFAFRKSDPASAVYKALEEIAA